MAGAGAVVVAKLVMPLTEPLGGHEALKAPHTSNPAFRTAMILFQSVILVRADAAGYAAAISRCSLSRMTGDDAALEEHLAQVAQRQTVAQPARHHERDDIREVLYSLSRPALHSLNCLPQSLQRNRR